MNKLGGTRPGFKRSSWHSRQAAGIKPGQTFLVLLESIIFIAVSLLPLIIRMLAERDALQNVQSSPVPFMPAPKSETLGSSNNHT